MYSKDSSSENKLNFSLCYFDLEIIDLKSSY